MMPIAHCSLAPRHKGIAWAPVQAHSHCCCTFLLSGLPSLLHWPPSTIHHHVYHVHSHTQPPTPPGGLVHHQNAVVVHACISALPLRPTAPPLQWLGVRPTHDIASRSRISCASHLFCALATCTEAAESAGTSAEAGAAESRLPKVEASACMDHHNQTASSKLTCQGHEGAVQHSRLGATGGGGGRGLPGIQWPAARGTGLLDSLQLQSSSWASCEHSLMLGSYKRVHEE